MIVIHPLVEAHQNYCIVCENINMGMVFKCDQYLGSTIKYLDIAHIQLSKVTQTNQIWSNLQ